MSQRLSRRRLSACWTTRRCVSAWPATAGGWPSSATIGASCCRRWKAFTARSYRRTWPMRINSRRALTLIVLFALALRFATALMTQTFYIVCLLAALDLALQLAEQPRRRDWLLLGATLGLGVLFRQTLLLFVPLLYLWIGARARAQLRWRDLLLSVAVLAACIAPWTLRNALVYQDFLLLNSNGGYFLYSANHPQQGTNFDPDYAAPLPDELR